MPGISFQLFSDRGRDNTSIRTSQVTKYLDQVNISRWVFPGFCLTTSLTISPLPVKTTVNIIVLSAISSNMTSNDDLMSFLKDLKIQAEKNNEEIKLQVKTRIDELAEKVDKVKEEASAKEKNDKENMSKLQKTTG